MCDVGEECGVADLVCRFLHLLTAIFHEVKDHKHNKQAQKDMEENSNNSY